MRIYLIAVLSMLTSLTVHSANEVSNIEGYTKIKSISVQNALAVQEAYIKLSDEAKKSKAPYFYITGIGGKERIHGSAILLTKR